MGWVAVLGCRGGVGAAAAAWCCQGLQWVTPSRACSGIRLGSGGLLPAPGVLKGMCPTVGQWDGGLRHQHGTVCLVLRVRQVPGEVGSALLASCLGSTPWPTVSGGGVAAVGLVFRLTWAISAPAKVPRSSTARLSSMVWASPGWSWDRDAPDHRELYFGWRSR